jgi:hypothetical protein
MRRDLELLREQVGPATERLRQHAAAQEAALEVGSPSAAATAMAAAAAVVAAAATKAAVGVAAATVAWEHWAVED